LTNFTVFLQNFVEVHNTKFHGNRSSGSRADTWDRQTNPFRDYVNALKKRHIKRTCMWNNKYETLWVCVYSLSYPACKSFLRCTILPSVACLAVLYFYTLSNKQPDFRNKVTER